MPHALILWQYEPVELIGTFYSLAACEAYNIAEKLEGMCISLQVLSLFNS